MRGFFTIIVSAVIFALAASCGGGGGGGTGARLTPADGTEQASPDAPPAEGNRLSREQELSRLNDLEPPEGVDIELWNDLKAALAALLPEKIVCTPPIGEGKSVTDLDFMRDEEDAGWLTWSYRLEGDYNVDGIVDVDDITPIAEHYAEVIGEENAWLSFLDSSGNGIVDIGDVTGIALNYAYGLAGFNVISGGPGFFEWEEIGTVARAEAEALQNGLLLFTFAAEPEDWSDFGVIAYDSEGATGEISESLEYRQPRIISVDAPSGAVGDFCTVNAVVEGEEPFAYDWVLGNGVSPNRSSEPSAEVELVQQGYFNGYLKVSNRFDERRHDFNVTVGMPPEVSSVSPTSGVTGERIRFTAQVTGSGTITYDWDFGPDSFPRHSAEQRPDAQFDEDGTHECSLEVSNAYGDFEYDFEVTVGTAPRILGVTPSLGTKGDSERFYPDVTGTEPLSYSWTFTGVGDPPSSTEERPLVQLNSSGEHQCKLVVTNAYGEATHWFNFYVGVAPTVYEVLWTTTIGNTLCYFFADTTGDFPMTWTWTFDMFAPDPPLEATGIPTAVWLPEYTGVFDCQLVAENEFGSHTFDFQFEITDVEPPPPL